MPVLTFRKKDGFRPVAIIHDGKYKGKILYLDPDHDSDFQSRVDKVSEKLNEFDLSKKQESKILSMISERLKKENGKYVSLGEEGGFFTPLPDFENLSMERPYVFGPAGSGKSYYIGKQCKLIKSVEPDKKIFLFSKIEKDKSLDGCKPMRIMLDKDFLDTELESNMFKNSICIFDDVDSVVNNDIRKKVLSLRDDLLDCGRHDKITIMCTSHLAANGRKTKEMLNECSSYTMFPKAGQTHPIEYICKGYLGMNKDQIERILKSDSRWVTVHKRYPLYVVSEKECYLL